ncbi:MAG: hypothetical protein QOF72_1285 [Blastocatellia bacterium]|nr:hypothetical protein [Blastocatellia bacterium]
MKPWARRRKTPTPSVTFELRTRKIFVRLGKLAARPCKSSVRTVKPSLRTRKTSLRTMKTSVGGFKSSARSVKDFGFFEQNQVFAGIPFKFVAGEAVL